MLNQRQLVVQPHPQNARHCHSTENIERIAGRVHAPPPPPAPSTRPAAVTGNRQKKRRSIFSFRSSYGKYDLSSPPSNDLQHSNATKLPRSVTSVADCRLAQCVDMCQNLALDDVLYADAEAIDQDLVNRNVVVNNDMTRSWHAESIAASRHCTDSRRSASPVQVNGPTNRLFHLNVIKRWSTRSRSTNNSNVVAPPVVAADNGSGCRRKSCCSTTARPSASPSGDASHARPAVRRTRPRSAHFNPNTIVATPKPASDPQSHLYPQCHCRTLRPPMSTTCTGGLRNSARAATRRCTRARACGYFLQSAA
jgi:hypothetical protein